MLIDIHCFPFVVVVMETILSTSPVLASWPLDVIKLVVEYINRPFFVGQFKSIHMISEDGTVLELPSMPAPRVNFALVRAADSLYAIGGSYPEIVGTHSKRVQRFDLKSRQWFASHPYPNFSTAAWLYVWESTLSHLQD